jgi:putative endonuclease
MSFWRKPESSRGVLSYYIYILVSRRNGTLYIGVTNNLVKRIYEHKNDLMKGFTKKYGVHTLVHYEQCESVESAIRREKQLKAWHRKWKISLIEETNREWKDLYDDIVGLDSSFRWNDNNR